MLQIKILGRELWDEKNEVFISTNTQVLCLEHSLVSLSKWEAKWHKPFFSKEQRSKEEIIDYIRCMTITQNVDPSIYELITSENIKAVTAYIEDPMTATRISHTGQASKNSRETITSELIYYWMVSYQIPFECQKWHLNRLLMLIQVCNEKNKAPTKYSKNEIYSSNAALNAARRKALGSKG